MSDARFQLVRLPLPLFPGCRRLGGDPVDNVGYGEVCILSLDVLLMSQMFLLASFSPIK